MSPSPSSAESVTSGARILVIDNREQVRRDLQRGLGALGYQVQVAQGDGERLHRSALHMAKRFRPHVAIVDLRLDDDYDTSDTTGLKLLSGLRSRCEGLQLIVYSAYLNPTVDRAISELGATWVDKSDAPQVLKETVGKLAAQSCAASRPFNVAWPKEWNQAHTVVKIFGKKLPPSLLDDIIAQLFEHGRRVWVYHIEDQETPSASPVSRGRSLVIKVQPQRGVAKKIVKVSTPDRVSKEARNYRRFIHDRLPGLFHTQLEASRTFWDIGASVYSFLGDDGMSGLCTFRNFYATQPDVTQLLTPVRFWHRMWSNHPPDRRPSAQSIYQQYDKLLGLKNNLRRISLQPRPRTFASVGAVDPLQWLETRGEHYAAKSGLRQMIHGDFHADNLFTDGERVWLVDFERTGYGPIYADFCELEIDVLTRLLSPEVPDEEFHRLVCALVDFNASDAPTECSDETLKALNFVRGLRQLAFETTGKVHTFEYQWGLLCDSLFVAGMRTTAQTGVDQTVQRDRAWTYASMLCSQIEDVNPMEALRP